jgi:ATP-dependent helicase/nuclease subunit B
MILSKEKIEQLDIDLLVDGLIKSCRTKELLIVVPTNRKLRNLKKEIISNSPGQCTSTINIETISTLTSKLLETKINFIPLSEAAASVLIKQCAEEIEFKYLINYKDKIPFGTLDRIKNVISEYKKHGITPEELEREAAELQKSDRLKAGDIAEIYKRFLKLCEELSAFDVGDVYRGLNNLSQEDFLNCYNEFYKEVKVIVINGFDEFTKHEVELINKLADIKAGQLYLNFDYYKFNPAIFSHLDKCYKQFEEKGFKKIIDNSKSAVHPFKQRVREFLFLNKTSKPNSEFKENIIRITAQNREKEIELIAREVKNLILNKNVEPHKICISFNVINKYSPAIRDIFEVYEIPVNLTDRLSLAKSYPVIAIINLLEILENDFYYKNIFRALSSGFININEINLSNLFSTAVKLKIVIGKNTWLNRIREKIEKIKYFDYEDDFSEEEIKHYQKAFADIEKLDNLLKPFTVKLTIDEFLKNLINLINEVKLPILLLEESGGKEEENIKAVAAFIKTLTEIFELLKKEKGSKEKFKLDFFVEQIRTFSSWARFNVKEKSNYGVQVTTVNEIRGLNFDYLFISGLCDGDFPTRYNPEIFFSGSFAKFEQMHQTEERYHFYQSLCSWNKKLYLTNPLMSGDKDLVESNFLHDFYKLFETSILTEKGFAGKIYSKTDWLEEFGKEYRNANSKLEVPTASELKLNVENILNAIDVDAKREKQLELPDEFSGILSETDEDTNSIISDALTEYSNKQYSVSELENYAKCPYKYFAERILKLEVLEEPEEEVEAIEIGSLLHSIFYNFYTAIREQGISLKNCDDKTFVMAEKILFEIAEEKIASLFFDSVYNFYEKEKIFGIGGSKKESILYKFLEEERMDQDDFAPAFFETSFGKIRKDENDKELSTAEPIEVDDIKFRGKIDRIDFNESEKRLNIIDYKLGGKKPTKEELWNGLSLQLPFYLYAAGKLLSSKYGSSIDGELMYIYSLKYRKEDFGKKKISLTAKRKDVDVKALNDELLESTLNNIRKYVRAIAEGKFPLSPHEDREKLVCGYCEFKSICRIQEVTK